MEPAAYLERFRADGALLAEAARRAPGSAVPTCPDWDMTDLVGHVGRGHRWFAEIVRTRATEGHWGFADSPGEYEALLAWYEEGLASLIDVLNSTGPDEPVWNWLDGKPAPARFWHRRAAQETAVHRVDAQLAAGGPDPIDTDLAVDGIDEHLGFAAFWLPVKPVEGLSGSLHLHATDTAGEWLLKLGTDRLDCQRSHAKADAAMRGPASSLLLWLVNRRPPESPELTFFGDRQVIDTWRSVGF